MALRLLALRGTPAERSGSPQVVSTPGILPAKQYHGKKARLRHPKTAGKKDYWNSRTVQWESRTTHPKHVTINFGPSKNPTLYDPYVKDSESQTNLLFCFFYTIPADMPAETTIDFTQNQFSGNTLAQPIVFQGEQVGSVEALVYSRMGYASASGLPGTDPTPQQFITVKNSFSGNTFDRVFSHLAFTGGQP
jgi:hypothetical protein